MDWTELGQVFCENEGQNNLDDHCNHFHGERAHHDDDKDDDDCKKKTFKICSLNRNTSRTQKKEACYDNINKCTGLKYPHSALLFRL